MTLQALRANLNHPDFPRQLGTLRGLLRNVQPEITSWGERVVTVTGEEGSIPLWLIINKVAETIYAECTIVRTERFNYQDARYSISTLINFYGQIDDQVANVRFFIRVLATFRRFIGEERIAWADVDFLREEGAQIYAGGNFYRPRDPTLRALELVLKNPHPSSQLVALDHFLAKVRPEITLLGERLVAFHEGPIRVFTRLFISGVRVDTVDGEHSSIPIRKIAAVVAGIIRSGNAQGDTAEIARRVLVRLEDFYRQTDVQLAGQATSLQTRIRAFIRGFFFSEYRARRDIRDLVERATLPALIRGDQFPRWQWPLFSLRLR